MGLEPSRPRPAPPAGGCAAPKRPWAVDSPPPRAAAGPRSDGAAEVWAGPGPVRAPLPETDPAAPGGGSGRPRGGGSVLRRAPGGTPEAGAGAAGTPPGDGPGAVPGTARRGPGVPQRRPVPDPGKGPDLAPLRWGGGRGPSRPAALPALGGSPGGRAQVAAKRRASAGQLDPSARAARAASGSATRRHMARCSRAMKRSSTQRTSSASSWV